MDVEEDKNQLTIEEIAAAEAAAAGGQPDDTKGPVIPDSENDDPTF